MVKFVGKLKTFIKNIGDNEEELLLNIYKIRNRLEKRDWPEGDLAEKLDKFMNIPTQSRNIENLLIQMKIIGDGGIINLFLILILIAMIIRIINL